MLYVWCDSTDALWSVIIIFQVLRRQGAMLTFVRLFFQVVNPIFSWKFTIVTGSFIHFGNNNPIETRGFHRANSLDTLLFWNLCLHCVGDSIYIFSNLESLQKADHTGGKFPASCVFSIQYLLGSCCLFRPNCFPIIFLDSHFGCHHFVRTLSDNLFALSNQKSKNYLEKSN